MSDILDKTTALGNVPNDFKKALEWNLELQERVNQAQLQLNEAVKATAETFDIPLADLKAGLKAIDKRNFNEISEKNQVKMDNIEKVFYTIVKTD